MQRVRMLVDQKVEGLRYLCNQVVDLPDALAKPLLADGFVDASEGAIAYATDVLKEPVLVHVSEARASVERELADKKVKLADLEAKYKAEKGAKTRAALGKEAETLWAEVKALTAKLEEMGN